MGITDKTRKVLWGRSGNRCAICRQVLVIERTAVDADAVVGDECHIHSGANNGPRHDESVDREKLDEIDNLLLLCRVHHKMVDDQAETYTADLLRSIKANHEKWVNAKFENEPQIEPIRVVRFKKDIPKHLVPVESGHALLNLVSGCHGHYPYHSDDLSDDEIHLVGGFIQNISDWADFSDDLDAVDKLKTGKSLTEEITQLKDAGFGVFCARERQQMRGGIGAPKDFYVYHIAVVQEGDQQIVPLPESDTSEVE